MGSSKSGGLIMSEKEYFPLDVMDALLSDSKQNKPQSTVIEIRDASTVTASVLAPEMGSDDDWKRKGKIDWRRFGHISELDPYWIAHFLLKKKFQGGNYSKNYANAVGNLNFSIGGRHKKLAVGMQRAVSGKGEESKKPKKDRSMLDKILGRNKEESEI